ncbi:MAG: hypothetical protein IKH23_02710 [Clostridiales bacterium]|nr:hypothetical protein [Clostridiales bacterium]
MSAKTTKSGKIIKIILTAVISLVLLAVLICGGITLHEATPHKRHFNKVILVSNKKYDGSYLYHASNNSGKVFILRTPADLREVCTSSENDPYDLGEQDLTVKATGIEIYRTDISGMNLSYPTIVYEYVSGQ